MLRVLYLAAFFISLLELIVFYESRLGKNNQNRMILFIVSFVANYGCAFESFSSTVGEALCGTQIYFIGNTLTFVFLFFVISDICTIKLNHQVERLFFFVALLIMLLVGICNHTDIFFKNLDIQNFYGSTFLYKEFGILYFLYPTFIVITFLACIAVIVISIKQRRKISVRTVKYLLVILTITILAAGITRLVQAKFEIYPFINIVLLAALLAVFKRASMYDMTENLINVYNQRQEYGYITFDNKRHFLGCNEFALKLIPELNYAVIDEYLKLEDSDYYSLILDWIDDWEKGKKNELKLMTPKFTAMATIRYIRNGDRIVGYLVEIRDVTSHQKRLDNLEGNQHILELQVEEKAQKIVNIQNSIITGIASVVESRDNSTGDHIRRTSEGVRIFVDQIKKHKEYDYLDDTFYLNVIKAAPMHDLGKISVHDAVLQKPGRFIPEEYDEMKEHTTEGAKIVLGVLREVDDENLKRIAVNVAHYHHERWNGEGYPCGLKGEEIPIEARIMAFADVFDALVTRRCYKDAYDYDTAFEIMEKEFGTHFDPNLGKIFLECKTALGAMYTLDALLNRM